MYLFEGLKQQISEYLPQEQVKFVQDAFVLAQAAHEGQMRSSGDPYITHPVAVSSLLASMKLDHETLAAALMHDVIEDTEVNREEIAEQFGETIADLVEGVSKLDKLDFKDKKEFQAENFRKMIMAMTQDIRVILIKLADRTHNMRTLGSLRPDKKRRIAKETLEIYAPIANRLGIHDFKNELENLGFEALYPMRSRALAAAVKQARGNRKEIIQNIQSDIATRIEESGLVAKVEGREKHLYSIYKKMLNKELMFNEVMDIYAFRIIVDDLDTCYRMIGVVHNLFKPIEGRFKDYIAIPKTNGYQSLHTSLVGPHGIPVEIQVRTNDMDQLADRGVAAHWSYKGAGDSAGNTAQQRARQWMQTLLELQQSAGSSFEFIENVKSDMFPEEIYVFTPDGKIHELPMGATPVDFAYSVHTDVGNTCVGAKVDRKPHPLSKPLDSGKTVEIVTSPKVKPNANWLNFVVTARARLGIRNYLKHQRANEAVNLGKRLLKSALGEQVIDDISIETIEQLLEDVHVESLDELYREIGLGNLLALTVANRMKNVDGDEFDEAEAKTHSSIAGAYGMLVNYAKCCHPVKGDEIVAHLSQGKGLTIHREDCPNCRGWEKDPAKYFKVKWDDEAVEKEYTTSLKIELINHQGALAKVTHLIAQANSNVEHLYTEEKESNLYVIMADVTVKNRVHLAQVIKKLRTMPDVQRIHRK